MIVERGYLDHWKTNLLRQLTGLPNAAELPMRLWEHCEARRDDFIDDPSGHIVAGICRAQIEPKALVKALVECRWIDKTRGGYVVHGWAERNDGWLKKINAGKNRSQRAKRNERGQLVTSNAPASSELATSKLPASIQLAGENPSKLAASIQLAGNIAGPVEWSGVENAPTTPCAGARTRETFAERPAGHADALSETWTFILDLLGAKKRKAGHEAEHSLARQREALPLSEEQQAILAWFYRLPHDERDVDLRSRFRDADRLAINLFSALERAETYAERHGGPKKNTPAAEPEGWREWFVTKWQDKTAPENFALLPDYVQQDAWQALRERSVA